MNEESIVVRPYKGYDLQREDPYGFWYILGGDGKKVSTEAYTNIEAIKNAVDTLIYLAGKKPVVLSEANKKDK